MQTSRLQPAGAHHRYRYVVIVLAAVYAVGFLDRQIINILGQSIKEEMHISDAQLGLLTGTAFAIFYSLLGLPIARLADRTHRVNVVTVSLIIWSSCTVLCGFAYGYLQLFLARLGVGVGEAGGTPPSQSLLADYVPPERRTLAFSLFNLGVPIGSFLGFLIGGYVNDRFGWRMAFVVAGVPGLALALWLKLTVAEPLRGAVESAQRRAVAMQPLRDTLRQLFAMPSFAALALGGVFAVFIVNVSSAWLPPMFIRVHGFSAREIGQWLALSAGLGGGAGVLFSGMLGTVLRRRWRHGDMWLVVVAMVLVCPMLLLTTLSERANISLAAMFVLYLLMFSWMGPMSARVQQVVPIHTRALAVGTMIFLSSVTALAFGPPLVGWLSDVLAARHGAHSLRFALAAASPAGILAAIAYGVALRNFERDLAWDPPR